MNQKTYRLARSYGNLLGARQAEGRIEGYEIAIAEILRRFPDWETPC